MSTTPHGSGAGIPSERMEAIYRQLHGGPRSAQELVTALGISQPTLSRSIQSDLIRLTSFRIAGHRTPQYALLRQLPGALPARQRIHRIGLTGSIELFAELEFLSGGATIERMGNKARLYEGLPPYMAFSAPSGFLGRQLARSVAAEMRFPESLKDWGDDQRIAYLFTRGMNLAGNLVYGDMPLHQEMEFRKIAPVSRASKLDHYVDMATQLKGTAYGSSAGGEQPKFLSFTEDSGHVIVKFAKKGSRMGELLPLEHLALDTLAQIGVPSSQTQLLTSGDYVFLESRRFDRVGAHGRVGMLSAGSVDDEFFGNRDSWSEFAARCEKAGYLSSRDARHIDVMAAFSELIGNGDRHLENISLLVDEDGEYKSVAPAYDILPMNYASIGSGVDPDLKPITPKVGTIGARPEVWDLAAQAATHFWRSVQANQVARPVSRDMRELATQNLAVVEAFVAPLLPTR